jgi:hypothetical protein
MEQAGFVRLIESLLHVEQVDPVAGDEAPAPRAPDASQQEAPRGQDAAEGQSAAPEEKSLIVQRALLSAPVDEASEISAEEAADIDLTPADLLISRPELEFMKALAPLFQTPRAAKRLANVYRLARVSVGAERLSSPDGHEPVLLLLSIAIAFPALVGDLLRTIAPRPSMLWGQFVNELRPEPVKKSPGGFRNCVSEELTAGEAAAWGRLAAALDIVQPAIAARSLSELDEWIELVAEFSFHPWQELLPAGTRG